MSDPLTLGLASTAVGLVNGTLDLLKKARDAAKQSDDHDLKSELSEVLDSVLELKEAIGKLRDENAELRKQLETRAALKWSSQASLYFADNDPDPFCPTCFDRDQKQIRLHWYYSNPMRTEWICRVCNNSFTVED